MAVDVVEIDTEQAYRIVPTRTMQRPRFLQKYWNAMVKETFSHIKKQQNKLGLPETKKI